MEHASRGIKRLHHGLGHGTAREQRLFQLAERPLLIPSRTVPLPNVQIRKFFHGLLMLPGPLWTLLGRNQSLHL